MFSKEPVVYANPHPAEQDFGIVGKIGPNNQKNASLRMRQSDHGSMSGADDPSSSALDVRTSGYYPE